MKIRKLKKDKSGIAGMKDAAKAQFCDHMKKVHGEGWEPKQFTCKYKMLK